MTISKDISGKYFTTNPNGSKVLIDIPPRNAGMPPRPAADTSSECLTHKGHWSVDEHSRFLAAMEMFPSGPWKEISAVVKTRTTRQVMSHAQKYRMKIDRHRGGLRRGQSVVLPEATAELDEQPLEAVPQEDAVMFQESVLDVVAHLF